MLFLLLPLVAAILVAYLNNSPLLLPQEPAYIEQQSVYFAHVQQIVRVKEKWVQLEVDIASLDSSYTDVSRILCYIQNDSLSNQIEQGDELLVFTKPTHFKHNPSDRFQYNQHLRLEGITAVCFVRQGQWKRVGHQDIRTLKAYARRLQQKVVNRFGYYDIADNELGVLAAMTVGERSELNYDIRESYVAAGAMHILAVSGLHVGIVYAVLLFILNLAYLYPVQYEQKTRKILNSLFIILFLWFYAFLTGLSPSVVRSALMFTIFTIANLFERDSYNLNNVFAAAFLTLCFNPLSLFSVSFQLSYSAVIAIIYFGPKLTNMFVFRNTILRYLWTLIAISIAAQIGTLPISWWYFNQVSCYFILTNIVVIPAASVIIYTAIASLFFGSSSLVVSLLNQELKCVNYYVKFIENLEGSTIHCQLSLYQLLILFASGLLLALYANKQKWYYLLLFAICCLCFALLTYYS